ncbi:Uma2 family endonuclease [Nostoc sp. LPT]|uniref:Uma2 family endonuclease n=1 Tax=Nostoc sp. LPT TaxID=2815387 RepID=UPI001D484174|nr:Uma2 family endonuclease [Nostoc sp. LPT]MBN4006682.1 Uma2 family endonuclease [Nostoc sp. LPT]
MVKSDPRQLPSSAELPCSDDTPVDNEDQNFIPNLLLFLLQYIWANRNDWFFSVDMGVYHTTGVSPLVPIVPDGFLSLGVERHKADKSRKSYVVWEENNIVPILALEIVSLTPGGEYDKKLDIYAKLGVLYYIIYNPEYWQRDRHQPFEVYRLVDGNYQLQIGEPFWMPEIGLGIGRGQYVSGNIQRQVLYWYDQQGKRYQTPEEVEQQTRQQLELVQQQLERYRQQFGELPEA